ncbi:hypothetical protein L596_027907 [Steinernema carpocapsae]|uniref:CUB domain-containing protein n=1 Tax=Steinernema carpocapsae TaxID=34508 RepID=A0A4U5LWY6_STECR|nr:hypothetical protein L596_027907 [Steinernema carpocapsae]
MYATRTCPTKFFDFDQNPSVVLSSDQFQSVEHFDNSVCRIHFKTNLGILVVIRNFFLFSHRRPKNSKGITVQESNGQLFLSQRRPLEQQYFFSDIDVEIPKNLNFRSTVVITDARLNCSKEGAAWKSCGRDVCIPVAAFCDGIENCADGFDERNCEEINLGNDAHNCLSPFSVIFRPFSSSLYMLIGFFLLNAFFVAFFIVLAICSLGFCYSRKFYQGQLRRSRRTFIRYLRSAHKQVEDQAQLPETILTRPQIFDYLATQFSARRDP